MVALQEEIMTLDEVQGYLRVPKATLYAMAQAGRIPAAKVGKHWRFRRSEIDKWFDSLQQRQMAHTLREPEPARSS